MLQSCRLSYRDAWNRGADVYMHVFAFFRFDREIAWSREIRIRKRADSEYRNANIIADTSLLDQIVVSEGR
jgi:hypothetical protein